jgi:hypothetical protein
MAIELRLDITPREFVAIMNIISSGKKKNMRTDKMHPLPWKHETNGKNMSAVVDANGHVVCGSLICICQQGNPTRNRQTHAYIVSCCNTKNNKPRKVMSNGSN